MSAYEIHMGNVERVSGIAAPFRILARNGVPADTLDGAINREGTVVGTMLHGIFDNDALRTAVVAALRRRRGLAACGGTQTLFSREAEYDRLAAAVVGGVDMPTLKKIAGLR